MERGGGIVISRVGKGVENSRPAGRLCSTETLLDENVRKPP